MVGVIERNKSKDSDVAYQIELARHDLSLFGHRLADSIEAHARAICDHQFMPEDELDYVGGPTSSMRGRKCPACGLTIDLTF